MYRCVIPIRNLRDGTVFSDYRVISLLSIIFNIMSVGFGVTLEVQTIMNSPDTREKIGVQWESESAINRLPRKLLILYKRNIVQYSH